jgi:type IV pilus assembly protein PilB
MELTRDAIEKMFVESGLITPEKFARAEEQAHTEGIPLAEELVRMGFVSDEHLGRTVADHFDLKFVDLSSVPVSEECLAMLPEVVARAQRAVVVSIAPDVIEVASERLDHYEFLRLLEKKTGARVVLSYATHAGIDTALRRYKGDLRLEIERLIAQSIEGEEQGSIVALVDRFLEHAYENRASDIHIEPAADHVVLRFRVDGLLHEAVRYPKALHEKIVFRTKIMARMQTDEHASAQDGRFAHEIDGESFDVRVSIIPITEGENIVMRLLDSASGVYSLENLGFGPEDYARIVKATEAPHGMIMAVGPTGSGKTTLLYALLQRLNDRSVNITSIEDPVEYHIEGVQQTQVNPKKDLTFAKGLRSIVRQDPDIIMVGEIRDEETADIAINAALTGHLLLSTLHTNDAATTFPRLAEMNVEPFLVASSVNLIIALRLVRKICLDCKESHRITKEQVALIESHPDILRFVREISGKEEIDGLRLYRGGGCVRCGKTGFARRVGIFETLEVDDSIRALVTKSAPAATINDQAIKNGMTSLLYDGVRKALAGVTTFEEVFRVAKT